jgi:pyruvate, water dikinase
MTERVLPLGTEACRSVARVGNKCASLAALRQGGYNVPDGFAVKVGGLDSPVWRNEVEMALRDLSGPWVVRSSSTVEDGAKVTFAGLFESMVGLGDSASVLAAIERIGMSVGEERVVEYARECDVDLSGIGMGMLVQSLVDASVAGVAFSRNPISGADETVIEVNYGLGETVVDGSVVPDGVRVAPGGEILARRLGRKDEMVIFSAVRGRLERVPTASRRRERHALSDRQARMVGELARRLERETGGPVDVEWAFAQEDDLYLLQCRPITTEPLQASRSD